MPTLTASAATTNWTKPLPHHASYGFPCLAYDQMWLCFDSNVYGYDRVTGALRYQLTGFNGDARAVQPFDDGLMVVSTDGNVYRADITGQAAPRAIGRYNTDPGWVRPQSGSVYLFAQKTGVWRVAPTNGGQVIGDVPNPQIRDFPVLAPGAVLVPRVPNFIDVFDPHTLAFRNTVTVPGLSIANFVGGASNGPVTFFVLNDTTVIALDPTLRSLAWRVDANAKLTHAATADPKYCYAGTTDGRVFVFDAVTGKAVLQMQFGSGPIEGVFQDEGLVYAVCTENNGRDIFIYAGDPETGTVAKHRTGQYGSIVGVDHGVVYYTDKDTVGAVRLADIVREFYAESVLVQDFAFAGGKEEKRPAVHSEITLYDRNGSPWAMQTVLVGCTSPITIESGGASYRIDAQSTASLKTDGCGKLRIDMPPGDVDSKGIFRSGLTSPALTLFTSFMDPDDRVLVRPDAQLHDELGKVTQSRLQNAQDYDKNFIVADKYRNDNGVMANVAAMINATSGMVKGSLENRNMLLAASGKRYLAPGCDMATICCCKAGDYACKLVCKEAFAFDLDPARSTFAYLATKDEIERWLAQHPVSHESLLMSWGDLWDAVKSGAAKIKNAVVYAARQIEDKAKDVVKTVVTAVVNGIERTMDFIVDTVEHAIGIIHGIFNEIVGAIDKVLQSLSLIFNWTAIVELKNEMKAKVEQSFDRLLKPTTPGGKSLLTRARERGNGAFAELRGKLDRAFDELGGIIGADSGAAVQNRNAGKNNPAKGGATSNWLQSKMSDSLLSSQAMQAHQPSAAAAPGATVAIPEFTLPEGLQGEISRFLDDLQSKVTADVSETIERLKSTLSTATSDLFSQSFRFFLDLVRGSLHIGLDVVSAVFDTAMRLLEKLLTAVWSYIRDNPITIPFVSDLYQSVVGSQLTGLDLACLLIAVPGSLAVAAISSGRRALAGTTQLLGILAGISQVVWSLVAGTLGAVTTLFVDKIDAFTPLGKAVFASTRCMLIAGFGSVARGLLLWSELDANDGKDDALEINTLLWSLPTLAVLVDAAAVPMGLLINPVWVSNGASAIVCTTGVCLAGLLMLFALEKRVKRVPAIVFNALVAVGLMVRLGTTFPAPQAKLIAIALTAALIGASGVVKILDAAGVAAEALPFAYKEAV
ncbi:outer membrane protein assembly factor BamB family protein [Bradyrhizobium mercantei]|uniref:outer membrane protein assembly factor BamB family protein n=1 Tax=Bradyrhizobium mercantei TaxID=1904807 RepID=UPI000975499E|nr:PQQ-binding-like beta-propeller repeat protein [Bradyrhizobium mercantei]